MTDKGILAANSDTGELELAALYPGVGVDDVRAAVGWDLQVRDTLGEVDGPSENDLRLLREVLDPRRLFLG